MLIALGIGFAIEPISRFMINNVNSGYLRFSFSRILQTMEDRSFISAIKNFDLALLLVYFCFIALSIYLFVISLRAKEKYKDEDGYKKTIANFTATVGAVAIGLSFNYLYLERFMYLVSYAYLMIIPIHNEKKEMSWENIIVLPVAFFMFMFNDIYTFMVNFAENYFFALG